MHRDQLEQRNRELEAEVAELKKLVAKLLDKIARLEKNSGNSSKPPSSDITKPKRAFKDRKGKKRKTGGQKGRKACVRTPFPPSQVDVVVEHTLPDLDRDPERYERLPDDDAAHQQVELVDRPWKVTEHRLARYRDRRTGRVITTPRPGDVRLGLFGPRMLAMTSCLKADLHGSYDAIRTFYRDALNLDVSAGFLAKATRRVSAALDGVYDGLTQKLREQPVVHVDETGHKECGDRWWTWLGLSEEVTVLKIQPGRGSAQLYELLGDDFTGTLCSDSFSAYLKFCRENPEVKPQYCWAHAIRDVRFVLEHGDGRSRRWADKVLDQIKRMFKAWHRGQLAACGRAGSALMKLCRNPGQGVDARRLGTRLWKQREGYLRFITATGIEPTNNRAERALRPVVLHRGVTQGTRGEAGRRWWERVFSVRATCRQHGRSVCTYLVAAIEHHAAGRMMPLPMDG